MLRKVALTSLLISICFPCSYAQSIKFTPIPADSSYQGNPACYVACYSNNKQDSVYYVGTSDNKNIYFHGLVLVGGKYSGDICKPTGYENADISADSSFKKLCNDKIGSCKGTECWAGGDTGGFFIHE